MSLLPLNQIAHPVHREPALLAATDLHQFVVPEPPPPSPVVRRELPQISGCWIADRISRRATLAAMAVLIDIVSLAAPWLLDCGAAGQDLFILAGFGLQGFSYGQAAGVVTSNFERRFLGEK